LPLATGDIPVDLCRAQRFERDDRIDDADAGFAVGADHADARPDMVPPPREQTQHAAQVRFVGRLFEDAAPDGDSRIARQHDLIRRALDGERFALGQPRDIGARQFALQRRFVDFRGGDARRRQADPRQQFAPAR
jgi:hypothetical protein